MTPLTFIFAETPGFTVLTEVRSSEAVADPAARFPIATALLGAHGAES